MIQCVERGGNVIDLKKANEEFDKYVKNYNSEDKKIALKIEHIKRVSEISGIISENLNLDKENIELAKLIGLLHDIGRFEQIKQYNTFSDKDSIDHGKLGVEILFKQGKIRNFIESAKYDEIIKKAILNHNRKEIEKGLNPKELLHSKIIRDADKIDILYIMTFEEKRTVFNRDDISDEKITNEIYEEFMQMKLLDYEKIQTNVDRVIAHFAYIYDFNFNFSYEYVNNKQYLDKIYKRHTFTDNDTMKRYNLIYDTAKKYIKRNQIIRKFDYIYILKKNVTDFFNKKLRKKKRIHQVLHQVKRYQMILILLFTRRLWITFLLWKSR